MSSDIQHNRDKDVIVLNKRTLSIAGIAVIILIVGGLVVYFLVMPTLTQDKQPSIVQVKTDNDPQIGPDNARVTIVEFGDFQCSYCKSFRDTTLDDLLEKYGDAIRFVYRDFPLPTHEQAPMAAEAAECANEQGKFWEMHDLLYANQDALSDSFYAKSAEQLGLDTQKFDTCLSTHRYASEVANDLKDGEAYGVTGTPTFFINGQKVIGAQPLSIFDRFIGQQLDG